MVSEAQRERMGVVGVGSIARAPTGEVDVGTRGRTAGAAHGAAEGAASGAAALFSSGASCSGPMCAGAYIVLIPVVVVVAATIGTVTGAVQAVPVDRARQIEAQLNLALAKGGQQEALRSEVVKAAAQSGIPDVTEITAGTATIGEDFDYRKLSNVAVDTVLEVGLVRIGLTGRGGDDPQLALGVHAAARLVDVKTNAELYRNYAFIHITSPRNFSEWSANEALLLKREIDRAYESLGRSIVDEVFLVFRTN